jgi:signal transduction histidine kinase
MQWRLQDEDDVQSLLSVPLDADAFSFAAAMEGIEHVSAAIGTASTFQGVLAAVASGAKWLPGRPVVTAGVADDSTGDLRLVAVDPIEARTYQRWARIPRSESTPLIDALKRHEPIYLESPADFLAHYPHLSDDLEHSTRKRWATIPVEAPNAPATGVIGLSWREPGDFPAAERLYLLTLARIGGEAVRRTARTIERRQLVLRLAESSERERIEIARDLHDHAIQRLAAVLIRIGVLARHDSSPVMARGLVELERETRRVMESLRDVIYNLHPPDSTHLTLSAAILDFAAWRFGNRLELTITGDDRVVPPEQTGTVLAIVREALANVVQHAQASATEVRFASAAGEAVVIVHDNGVGIPDDMESIDGHIGILAMRERAESAGGTLRMYSDHGGVVELRLPGGAASSTAAQ